MTAQSENIQDKKQAELANKQMPAGTIINVQNLNKKFKVGIQEIHVLKNVNVQIQAEDFAVVFGPSGCGKSTFLHTILGLEPPTDGRVEFLNTNLYENNWDEDFRAEFRKKHIGMVYQQANWVKSLTVRENVAFPLLLLGIEKARALAQAYEALKQVEMEDWSNYIPTELSGGQQQRVAMARALVNNPEVIIADEPTGNLDYNAGQKIMQLFQQLNKEARKTVIMVTHDLEYIKYAKSAIRMLDGQVIGVYGENDKENLIKDLKFKRIDSITTEKDAKPEQNEAQDIPAPAELVPQQGTQNETMDIVPEKQETETEQNTNKTGNDDTHGVTINNEYSKVKRRAKNFFKNTRK